MGNIGEVINPHCNSFHHVRLRIICRLLCDFYIFTKACRCVDLLRTDAQIWRLQPRLKYRLDADGQLTMPGLNGDFFFNTLGRKASKRS
ncbi:hypothetical protein [Acidovorax sp. CCYZU-2555]|uniref:hypothetical protein n=1 Tax=Acidovorax sp. CCYZU-2555 TaxID=2835042 RepID=UPI001BCBA89E|nr:hypothetical protein [Acidovorax sp. CCYZU-2555]MBS7781148.1 hypothetical protein [Acidovorax sp. CCYZU-2555]